MREKYEDELAKKYRDGSLSDLDRKTIDKCFENDVFQRGQFSILFPFHYKAFSILFHNTDLDAIALKKQRENHKTTRTERIVLR